MADPVLAMPPQAEEKRWSLGDVLLIVVMYAVALTVGMLIALGIAHARGLASASVLADPIWLFPVQLFGYVVALACARVLVSLKTGKAFFASIGWNYPGGERLPQLLLLGLLLTIAISVISSFLPSPPDLPVMKMMATRRLALATMLFATLFAPFAEEVFFRGIFYGALRWSLERERTRTAIGIVLLALAAASAIVAWRGAGSGYVLFGVVLLVIGGLLFPFREENAPLLDEERQTAIAIVLTSLLFAFVHGTQLGNSWGPILAIFIVGLVLTAVRVRLDSVAASWLVHTGYNGTLFLVMWAGTQGFTKLG